MELEGSEGSSTAGMHDSFGDPFVVEAHDLHWSVDTLAEELLYKIKGVIPSPSQ